MHSFKKKKKPNPPKWNKSGNKCLLIMQNICSWVLTLRMRLVYPWSIFWKCCNETIDKEMTIGTFFAAFGKMDTLENRKDHHNALFGRHLAWIVLNRATTYIKWSVFRILDNSHDWYGSVKRGCVICSRGRMVINWKFMNSMNVIAENENICKSRSCGWRADSDRRQALSKSGRWRIQSSGLGYYVQSVVYYT